MTTSPKVVFNSKFTRAFNSKDAHYTNKQIEGLKKKVARKFDYFSNEEKRVMNLFEYYTGNINKKENMNLVIEDGSYATKDEIKKRKKRFVKYVENSNLWQCIISFNNDYINENITLKELEQELIKNVLPRLFKKMEFKDKRNMAYNLSFHTDTDNLHAHISFIEKKPNYIYGNKKIGYRRKGQLTQDEINFMKNEVVFAVERKKYLTPMIINTNKEIDELKKYFNPKDKNFILMKKKDLLLEDDILQLGKLLYKERKDNNKRIKYNSINDKEIKDLTKKIKKYLFYSKDGFHDEYKQFKESIRQLDEYLYKVNQDNNISKINIDRTLSESKNEYIDNYIYNAIVNHADYMFKSKSKKYKTINPDEILREIILKEYKKNINQTRFNILNNYLSNTIPTMKCQNKYMVINAVKSINAEMEEAQKEFSKLFQPDNSYSKQ